MNPYVTKWGFPGLRWYDTIANMTGNPLVDNHPSVKQNKIERRLWIAHDGRSVCHWDGNKEGLAGYWDEWDSIAVGSSDGDLSVESRVWQSKNRLRYVQHHTLLAYFSDGTVNRIAYCACTLNEIQDLHRIMVQRFLEQRPDVPAPLEQGSSLPGEKIIEAMVEPRMVGENNKTRANVPWHEVEALMGSGSDNAIKFWQEKRRTSVEWQEPMFEEGLVNKAHLVRKMLYVGHAVRAGMNTIRYSVYRPDGLTSNASGDLALLEGFEVMPADSLVWPKEWIVAPQLMKGGFTVLAKFRYGYCMPLTNIAVEGYADYIRDILAKKFMAVVGKVYKASDLRYEP